MLATRSESAGRESRSMSSVCASSHSAQASSSQMPNELSPTVRWVGGGSGTLTRPGGSGPQWQGVGPWPA